MDNSDDENLPRDWDKINTTVKDIVVSTRESVVKMLMEYHVQLEQLRNEGENMYKDLMKRVREYREVRDCADMNVRSKERIKFEMQERIKTIFRNYIRQMDVVLELLREDI